jgi:hypothetical protein
MHQRSALLTVLLASGIALAGCSSASTGAPPQSATPSRVGQPATNVGVAVTVESGTTVPSIALNQSGYRPGSGYEIYTDTPAGAGDKYVLVSAHVVNNQAKPLDLSCGATLTTFAKDDQGRDYPSMDQLNKVKGNPQCDEMVEPGQAANMTWVYRAPADAHMVSWQFQDSGGFFTLHRHVSPTLVQLDNPVT